jgi:hypothetical protein
MQQKTEVLNQLRSMLADVFAAKAGGESYGRLARAHGYVDGFMRALLDTNYVSKGELLEVVAQERERAAGPATRQWLPAQRSRARPARRCPRCLW